MGFAKTFYQCVGFAKTFYQCVGISKINYSIYQYVGFAKVIFLPVCGICQDYLFTSVWDLPRLSFHQCVGFAKTKK